MTFVTGSVEYSTCCPNPYFFVTANHMGRSSNSLSTHRAPLSCLAIVPNFCEVVPFVAPAINQMTTLEMHLQSILPQTSLLKALGFCFGRRFKKMQLIIP